MMLELPFLTLIIIDVIKKLSIEIGPFLKGILMTEQAWCHILRNQSSLNQDSA